MKILVADDEPTVRRIMQAFLEKNHHEVVIAEGGRQAFELLKEEGAPHVAIIDWMMPDLTGPEVLSPVTSKPATSGRFKTSHFGRRVFDRS